MNAASPGLMGSIKQLGSSLLLILSTRLALLANELQEERLRLMQMLSYALLGLFCLAMAVLLLTVFVVVFFWDNHRLLVLGFLCTLFFFGAGLMVGLLTMKVREGSRLFAASLAELAKDRQALSGSHD